MANPKELPEAADAIRDIRRLPAVQRHKGSKIGRPGEQVPKWLKKVIEKLDKTIESNKVLEDQALRTNTKPAEIDHRQKCSNCEIREAYLHCDICGDEYCSECINLSDKFELLVCDDCVKAD